MSRTVWNDISTEVLFTIEVMTLSSQASGEIEARVANTCIAILIGLSHHEGCPEDYRVLVGNLEFTGMWGASEIKAFGLLKRLAGAKVM